MLEYPQWAVIWRQMMSTPKSTNQNSQQEAGHDRPRELAGNYGGGSQAGNEADPGEAPRGNLNFSQPVERLESDQMGGERAERGASLQRGANAGDRDAGGGELGRPDNSAPDGTSMQREPDARMAAQSGAPAGDARGAGWGNTGDAEGGTPLGSRNAAPANRIDERAGQDSPLLRSGSQGSQQSAHPGDADDSLIRRGNGSPSQARSDSYSGGAPGGASGSPRDDQGRKR
jgi:hypothetical protein